MIHPRPTQAPIVGILLAGGFSRRFGQQNKLLHALPDGQLIALSAAQALIKALPASVAVIRRTESALATELRELGFVVVQCEDKHQQMSDSLKLGVLAAQSAFPHLAGLVIALADMPFIQAETIKQVAAQLAQASIVQTSVDRATMAQAKIVQPVWHGQPGHPVGFSSALIAELLTVEGDQGARAVIHAHQAEVLRWACEDAGILRDIDTPADLA